MNVPVFFGLKNFYGYLGRLGRGELINKTEGGGGDIYVVPRLHTSYSMNSLTGLQKVASIPAAAEAKVWESIQQISMQNLCHAPTVSGTPATTSTYYCDAFWSSNVVGFLRTGGGSHSSNGLSYGLFAFLVNYVASYSDWTCGVSLSFKNPL